MLMSRGHFKGRSVPVKDRLIYEAAAREFSKEMATLIPTTKKMIDILVDLCPLVGISLVGKRDERIETISPKRYVPSLPVESVCSAEFLQSYEWRRVRMEALKKYGARCQCCGATPATGAVINVDHIKPRKLFPQLALSVENLQVLCHECNHGKGNWDMTDWRDKTTDEVFEEIRQYRSSPTMAIKMSEQEMARQRQLEELRELVFQVLPPNYAGSHGDIEDNVVSIGNKRDGH